MGPNTLKITGAVGAEGSPDAPVWATPYGTGPLAPLYASGGFSVGDDDDDDSDDDADDDADDDGRKVTLSAKDLRELRNARRGAGKQVTAYKKMLRAHGIDPQTGTRTGPARRDAYDDDDYDGRGSSSRGRGRGRDDRDDDRGPDPRAVRKAAREAEERGYTRAEAEASERIRSMVAAVPTALESAGFTGTPGQFSRALKLVDLDGIEDSDDLAEAIKDLKDDFPDWFRKRAPRRRPASRDRDDDGDQGQRRGTLRGQDRRSSGNRGGGKGDGMDWARNMGVEAGVISRRDS